jgi:small subunit ribosomal protein S18
MRNQKPPRRRRNLLRRENVTIVDWKDTTLLRKFLSDRGKIRARRVTGLSAQEQREVARAIKNAREMALLPYPPRAHL